MILSPGLSRFTGACLPWPSWQNPPATPPRTWSNDATPTQYFMVAPSNLSGRFVQGQSIAVRIADREKTPERPIGWRCDNADPGIDQLAMQSVRALNIDPQGHAPAQFVGRRQRDHRFADGEGDRQSLVHDSARRAA